MDGSDEIKAYASKCDGIQMVREQHTQEKAAAEEIEIAFLFTIHLNEILSHILSLILYPSCLYNVTQ